VTLNYTVGFAALFGANVGYIPAGSARPGDEPTHVNNIAAPLPLHERAGIDVTLDPASLTLTFGDGVAAPAEPERRSSRDLVSVLRDPDAARSDDALYTVYRGIARREAADVVTARGLVYVALVMRPGTVGREYTRTRGHTNNAAQSTAVAYPEVHEVWHGHALLYLQKRAAPDPEDVCVLPLGPGDTAVVAPGWASLLANVGAAPLVIGTWRTADCVPQHRDLEVLGGMAHYVVADRNGGHAFEPNRKYEVSPRPRLLAPHERADFGLKSDEPMLTTFRRNPDFLRFLLRPQDYDHVWARLYRGKDVSG
jgi:oxalate decarboxylase/phosphoglucose isomerase-like protein (cupin superfamily)